MPHWMRTRYWLALWVSLLLAGCQGNDAEQPWIAYHQQLAKDLSSKVIERTEIPNIGAFPERRERLIPVAETRDGMLNIYALRECQITSLIAARNNQLGRVAPPSQHWLYERELWQRLDACWESDIPDHLGEKDRERLEQLTLLKTAQLPAVSWNAIFDSEEWINSFSRASHPLVISGLPNFDQQFAAVDYLQQMVDSQFSQAWQQDSSRLENHLKHLQERSLTAEILRTLLLAAQSLQDANQFLIQHESTNATCLTPWDDMQTLDSFEDSARQWLTAINTLITSQPVEPPDAIKSYQAQWLSLSHPQTPWQQYLKAREQHQMLRDKHPVCVND
ncbi:DUF3080 family protein [Halomonas colorata]|uniref:DUF3080 family protein n=1 Tax=Halomonas colorata TaxID=2742615 RepID=A0ABR9FWT9_9GAMM|nr:DUF3080 family protein [Halomonas colorata]MBE0463113.1 DUF3080 family protein [Halomonas colorata]